MRRDRLEEQTQCQYSFQLGSRQPVDNVLLNENLHEFQDVCLGFFPGAIEPRAAQEEGEMTCAVRAGVGGRGGQTCGALAYRT